MRISTGKTHLILTACLALLPACSSNPQGRQALDAGESALRAGQYDQALRDADSYLAHGNADDLAEAYYLRGKVLEERQPKPDADSANRDLLAARSAYSIGLSYHPSKSVEALLHGQLGNVCYFLDDYPAALHEWNLAYAQLEKPEWKQWVLYRIGLCQQRLGLFQDADRTFEMVEQTYPNTQAAARAQLHHGVRGFYVQVGAFSQPSAISDAIAAITSAGGIPVRARSNGLMTVRTESFPSYAQAQSFKARVPSRYPDAEILP